MITPEQLRLAASIIETGHPWETSHNGEKWWPATTSDSPAVHVLNNQQIRLAFARPPYPATLHNPDNLTDEIPWIEWHGGECPLKDEEVEEWEYKGVDGFHCKNPMLPPSHYKSWRKGHALQIIAFRVLKWHTPKPKVPLGPEDVPPFSAIRRKPEQDHNQQWHWRCVSYVHGVGVQCGNRGYKWEELQKDYQINRSIPLTGKWNPDAWEPCEK